MKRSISFAALLLFLMGSIGMTWAQDTPPDASRNSAGQHGMKVRDPRVGAIMGRVKTQQDGINVGLKNGSLTKGQAKDLSAKVKAVKEQVRSDFKQNRENGQKGLTDDQVQQLNKMLDENAAAIPELK